MTLVLKILPTEAPASNGFYIESTSGSYSTTNTEGFGSPNPDIADVLSCTATVTLPDPDGFLPSTDPALTLTKDVYYGSAGGTLPNTTGVKQFIDAVTDLGYDEFMQNGIYAVSIACDIDVSGSETVFTSDTYYMLVDNGLICCITKQGLTINLDECGDCLKRDSSVWNTMLGEWALDQAYWAWFYAVQDGTGDFSKCAEYLEFVTNICNNCAPCGC